MDEWLMTVEPRLRDQAQAYVQANAVQIGYPGLSSNRPRSRSPNSSRPGVLVDPPPPPPPLALAVPWLIPNITHCVQKFEVIRNDRVAQPCEMYLWVDHRVSINNHMAEDLWDPGMNAHGEWSFGDDEYSIKWCWQGTQGMLKVMTYRRHPRIRKMWCPVTYQGAPITDRGNWQKYYHVLQEHDCTGFQTDSAMPAFPPSRRTTVTEAD